MGGHTVSHPGYLPDYNCLVDNHAVLLRDIFSGGGESLQNSCIDELSST